MMAKLKLKDYLFIASLLFGMFFGAGNLIFPVFLGQEAGNMVFIANLGFLVTAIGLPLLAVAAMGISSSDSVLDLARKSGDTFGYAFTIALYLVIGPLFAIPRLATTSYEVALAPYISDANQEIVLASFCIAFFVIAWFFSRTSSSALHYVAKFLNPLCLVALGILLTLSIVHPMGSVQDLPAQGVYQTKPFVTGFLGGYNTLDALAGLAFGIIVTSSIRKLGVTDPKGVATSTIKSGILTLVFMAFIYTLLSWLGATSVHVIPRSKNGGELLAQVSSHYLGTYGSILLSIIVTSACMTTAVGLITAFSETFATMFPKFSYAQYAVGSVTVSAIISMAGLSFVLEATTPVLMFIYPLAIVLILLSYLNAIYPLDQTVYKVTLSFTMLVALIDALAAMPTIIKSHASVSKVLEWSADNLPLMKLGLSWILPAVIGLTVGLTYSFISKKKS
ncbi:branched-chain amino acid transport system II carrier protein [Allofustis seminis]|uniref:branched-chain amino acid transport system II carrier protein n=1 Tax=Allofustis seminis TaxID=166939 RepID=UPI0003637298|nr:branched-chain amino acid transport system II carrier protein [Allofustis seminis]